MPRVKHADGEATPRRRKPRVKPEQRVVEPVATEDEKVVERAQSLRPTTFRDYVGQRDVVDAVELAVRAARMGRRELPHFLFTGPPGLGKTTMAGVVAAELGVNLHVTSGPAVDNKGMLASLLTSLGDRDVLFIDEIHRLPRVVEESLYPAMEDFKFDLFIGDGPHAKAVSMSLSRFTLLGATTRRALLSAPLLDRFGFVWQMQYYGEHDLADIVMRAASRQGLLVEQSAATAVASRSRGTPRIAHRLLGRARDYAEVHGTGVVTEEVVAEAMAMVGVDARGLDAADLGYLRVVAERGPVGVEVIAGVLGESRDTVESVEAYLLQVGFVERTSRGRVLTKSGADHLRGNVV